VQEVSDRRLQAEATGSARIRNGSSFWAPSEYLNIEFYWAFLKNEKMTGAEKT
jgi:hypothetical protein